MDYTCRDIDWWGLCPEGNTDWRDCVCPERILTGGDYVRGGGGGGGGRGGILTGGGLCRKRILTVGMLSSEDILIGRECVERGYLLMGIVSKGDID